MIETKDAHFETRISEFEDLEMRGFFNILELSEVLRQRNLFENNIKQRKLKVDYLRYIEYETKIGLIIEHRAKSRAIIDHLNKSLADYCTYRRIDSIFYRASRNFDGNPRFMVLWLWYYKNLKQMKKNRDFTRTIARAIHLQPKSRNLWFYATIWGLIQNQLQDSNHVRTLIQSSLKENQKNRSLWINYFRFELCSTMKFLNSNRMCHKTKENSAVHFKNQNIDKILDGTYSMTVFYSAINVLPFDDELRFRCAQIITTFDANPKISRIEEEIYNSIAKSFSNTKAWDARSRLFSRRYLLGISVSISSKHIGRVAREYLLASLYLENSKTHEIYTASINEFDHSFKEKLLLKNLKTLFYEISEQALTKNMITASHIQMWIFFLIFQNDMVAVKNLLRFIIETKAPISADMFYG
jgi:hypothetical protein